MKLTRSQLRKIISESINEQNFVDKIKEKGKDIKDKATSSFELAANNLISHMSGKSVPPEKDKTNNRVLAYFQDGDYKLTGTGKMFFTDVKGKEVTILFKSLESNTVPFLRFKGYKEDWSPLSPRVVPRFVPGYSVMKQSGGPVATKDDVNEARDFLIEKFKELGGKPAEDLNESLSRGSLYRRRYHGRYWCKLVMKN